MEKSYSSFFRTSYNSEIRTGYAAFLKTRLAVALFGAAALYLFLKTNVTYDSLRHVLTPFSKEILEIYLRQLHDNL